VGNALSLSIRPGVARHFTEVSCSLAAGSGTDGCQDRSRAEGVVIRTVINMATVVIRFRKARLEASKPFDQPYRFKKMVTLAGEKCSSIRGGGASQCVGWRAVLLSSKSSAPECSLVSELHQDGGTPTVSP
jgi:hypothetical protein